MQLLSPIINHTLGETFNGEAPHNYKFNDPVTGQEFTKTAIILFQAGKELMDGEEYHTLAANTIPPDSPTLIKYYALSVQKGHCVENAENLNDKLRRLLQSIPNLEYDKEKYSNLSSIDFMGLRNILSEYIKKYLPLRKITQYNSNNKISNAITKPMFQFVTDRNIYTHGQLLV